MFVPDSAHLLNNAAGGIGSGVVIGVSGVDPFQPGVRMEYTDEFVVGAEHEFRGGIILSGRYIDRRLKRVVEDEGGISVEQFNALAFNGGGLNYFIGNPNAKQDIFVNPNEIVFDQGILVPKSAQTAANLPAACRDSTGNPTPFVVYNQQTGIDASGGTGIIAGSACFPAVNTNTWTTAGGALLPDCTNIADSKVPGKCAAFGGEF